MILLALLLYLHARLALLAHIVLSALLTTPHAPLEHIILPRAQHPV